jgi:hypothetical protein
MARTELLHKMYLSLPDTEHVFVFRAAPPPPPCAPVSLLTAIKTLHKTGSNVLRDKYVRCNKIQFQAGVDKFGISPNHFHLDR